MMKEQKNLPIIKIDEIMINPENPRHNEVQLTIPGMGEELIMKQLIRDRETANKMFDLIKSIYESGFIPSLAVILEYKEVYTMGWKQKNYSIKNLKKS